MAVDQNRGRVCPCTTPFPEYYRVLGRFQHLYVEP